LSTLQDLQGEITRRMRRGDSFEVVESELIDPSALSDAEKAALWLYGWSFVHWRAQRREAVSHIDQLSRSEPAPLPRLTALHAVPDGLTS
jgi:hypothetical protein